MSTTLTQSNMKKKLIIMMTVFISTSLFNSCYNSTKYELTIDKEPYFGNELRIDGYYYYNKEDGNGDYVYTELLFFYRNGVVFYGSTFSTSNFDTIEKFFLDAKHEGFIKHRDVWSKFNINDDSLIFELWSLPTLSQGPQPIIHYCKIENDSTFNVYNRKLYSKNEFDEVSLSYHFRKFDHKPDSTNSFID